MAQERSLSDMLLNRAEHAAQDLLSEALDAATRIIEQHRPEMDRLVEALLEEETLDRTAIAAILAPDATSPDSAHPAARPGAAVAIAASAPASI
jgi:cell division protease FtsH